MDINNFVMQCIGVDEEKKPNSLIDMSIMKYNIDTGHSYIEANKNTNKAQFYLFCKGEFIEIGIEFESDMDVDFKTFKNTLMNLDKMLNEPISNEKNKNEQILFDVTICPHVYNGQHTLVCRNHLTWGIQPNLKNGKLSCIKLLYYADNIFLSSISDEEFEKLEKEHENELKAQIKQIDEQILEQENQAKKIEEFEKEKDFDIEKFNQIFNNTDKKNE